MKRIVRLTESDLARIVKRVINEQKSVTIPQSAAFSELEGDNTPWLRLTPLVGGFANPLAGYKDVVEFDANLRYVKTYGGSDKQKYANKVMKVKAYFGCKSNLFTTKNPSDGTTQEFGRENGDNLKYGRFVDWALTSGVCPKGSQPSQSDLFNAYRKN